MTYNKILFLLLAGHQLFYSDSVADSFCAPKWFFISVGLSLFLLCFFAGRSFFGVRLSVVSGFMSGSSKAIILLSGAFFLLLPLGMDLWHANYSGIFFSLGLPSLFLLLIIFFINYKIDFSGFSLWFSLVLSGIIFLEYFGGNPFFQGSVYHLSAFSGNPNIIAASLLFWYCPALGFSGFCRKYRSYKKFFSILIFLALLLTFSRAAILVFLLLHLMFFVRDNEFGRKITKGRFFRSFLMSILCLIPLFFLLLLNPFDMPFFSHYGIRVRELSQSLKIIAASPFEGVGRNNYRRAYWQSLAAENFVPAGPGVDNSEQRHIRLSDESHFSLLWPFLSFGLPLGFLWLLTFAFLLYTAFRGLGFFEISALISLLLAAQVYYIFYFSLILIPFMLIFAKGLANAEIFLISTNVNGLKKTCFLLLFVFIWAFFCTGEFNHKYLRERATEEKDFVSLRDSFFADGEDSHRYATFLIEKGGVEVEKRALNILDEACVFRPDPSCFYHRALIFQRRGSADEAMAELEKGLRILPTSAVLYYARALISESLSDQIYNYRLALSMKYNYFRAWNNLGICYFEKAGELAAAGGEKVKIPELYEKSAEAFEKALIYGPKDDIDYMDGLQIRYRTVLSLIKHSGGGK
jgi:tetratricopeptide (TPR) repeat protein